MKPPGAVDLLKFRVEVRDALRRSGLDAETIASLFGSAVAVCAELETYREGAQTRTLEQAAHVASVERELLRNQPSIEPRALLAAIMERTGYKRTKVYRLRQIRRPVLNGNPDLNGTRSS